MALRHLLLVIPIILAVLIAGLLGYTTAQPKVASAQATIPFGGEILEAFWCTCSAGIALTIGPPVPGQYVFQFGTSIPYPFGQVFRPGPWVLGLASPGGTCSYYIGTGCSIYPVMGTIGIVGTSL